MIHSWLTGDSCVHFVFPSKKVKKKSTNLSWSRHCHLNRTCSNCESSSALSPTRCCKDSWIDWACQEKHDVQSFRTRKPILKKRWPRQDTYGYHNNTPPNTTWHTDGSLFNSPHPWAHFVIDQGLKLLSQVLARKNSVSYDCWVSSYSLQPQHETHLASLWNTPGDVSIDLLIWPGYSVRLDPFDLYDEW